MIRLFLICGFALSWVAVASADPPKEQADTVTIPLDQIWAYRIEGTRDVLELEPEQAPKHLQSLPPSELQDVLAKRLWYPVVMSLCADSSSRWPRDGQTAGPGFAVAGEGRAALEAAFEVLANGKKPSDTFSTDTDISLVILAYQCGEYVELQGVKRRGDVFTITYRFIRPLNKVQSAHFALIPVGSLAAGHYRFEIQQDRTGQELEDGQYGKLIARQPDKPTEEAWGRRFVSGAYSFSVTQGKIN